MFIAAVQNVSCKQQPRTVLIVHAYENAVHEIAVKVISATFFFKLSQSIA